jgi:hypothetical protein
VETRGGEGRRSDTAIEVRDIEPHCAIFFDPQTLKGEDFWLNGKVVRPFLVFPIPD